MNLKKDLDGIGYSLILNDNDQIKILHVKFDKLKSKEQVQRYLD